ncbi:DNA/RNA non-specific endonuclease [Fundidesulfovibrio terrae]|uniref:DNA/RNA non-specific endonuclease n=1 Tax=Fundidesulfovibrio terrae TaxID=2922866 RepID=UPI001FAEFC82|nr:DNA/RNA non-specific endonuclease [Fundidesulfovibrio terrae]
MKRYLLVLAGILLFPLSCFCAETVCPQHYLDSQAPDIFNTKVSGKVRELCFQEFAVVHSGITRTPLISAECLTADAQSKEHPERKDAFHKEGRLPASDRAELIDYDHSGFDRGHMAPCADMTTVESQKESFSLANMVPQDKNINRSIWKEIEETVRGLAVSNQKLYVVTGPVFSDANVRKLNGRVAVPAFVFKAIYDPINKKAGAYIVKNVAKSSYSVISIAELERITGVTVFIGLPPEIKASAMELPAPSGGAEGGHKEEKGMVSGFSPALHK